MFLSTLVIIVLVGACQGHRLACKSRDFRCFNGKCISFSDFCNKIDDCGDNSDEDYCRINSEELCPEENGIRWNYCKMWDECYPKSWVCDGYPDCADGFDEEECRPHLSCRGAQFQCSNEICIQRRLFCDGDNDCGDHSDEEYCDIKNNTHCPPLWLRCSNSKRCYPKVWRCDGRTDCQDGSDEKGCPKKSAPGLLGHATESLALEIETIPGVEEMKKKLTSYFLNSRQSKSFINKWGPYIAKTAVALFLSDKQFFTSGNRTGEDIALEMSLKLMSKLSAKHISTEELSSFINGLIVACVNPREFFGRNLVSELRKRVNSSKNTNPFSILTLCNAKEKITQQDFDRLKKFSEARLRPVWTDAQAMVAMAYVCISKQQNPYFDAAPLKKIIVDLKQAQHKNGTVDNLKSTALAIQALLAADSYEAGFNLSAGVAYIMQELKSNLHVQDLYYVLPVFNLKSLVDISSNHCVDSLKTDLEVLSNLQQTVDDRIQVQISICIGDDEDYIRTWKVKVPQNYTVYDVLENMGKLDPRYKTEYSVFDGKPYVTALNNFRDSVEDSMFWFIYTKPTSSTSKPELIKKSPAEMEVNANTEVILWYRSGLDMIDKDKNTP